MKICWPLFFNCKTLEDILLIVFQYVITFKYLGIQYGDYIFLFFSQVLYTLRGGHISLSPAFKFFSDIALQVFVILKIGDGYFFRKLEICI